jgi:phosphoglycolate phosphatase-like HAD superfamily hydrolase
MFEILRKYEAVLWDFDGVLLDSNPVREIGFTATLQSFPSSEVQQLLEFHRANGGLSRYVKFRYFFEEIRNEPVSDEQISMWAQRFSGFVKSKLFSRELQIREPLDWIAGNHLKLPMHIVSGSDQAELREICAEQGITHFFKDIFGSPEPKTLLVSKIIKENGYRAGQCVLVGDSINDYSAASENGLLFLPYNNPELLSYNTCR